MYQGFFINLDRSAARRARMERQIARLGRPGLYARSAAFDADAHGIPDANGLKKGEIACFISHFNTIEAARDSGRHLHIVEDDAVLPDDLADRIAMIVGSDAFDRYDLMFTETIIPISADYIREYQRIYRANTSTPDAMNFSAVEAKGMYRASASSYIVNRNSARKIADLLQAELADGPHYPIDIFFRILIESGRLRAGIVVPFITAVELDDAVDSTIPDRVRRHDSVLALTLLRTLFYKDCDAGRLLGAVREALVCDGGAREEAVTAIMKFGVFGDYKAV